MRRVFGLYLVVTLFLILVIGCITEKSCLTDNPCIKGYYNESLERCEYTKLSGELSGCNAAKGCTQYMCINGVCVPERLSNCCGNQFCEVGETGVCSRDCGTSCSDGIRNQGEEDVDCGGPCTACISQDDTNLKIINNIYTRWGGITEDYQRAIQVYNENGDVDSLVYAAVNARDELFEIQQMIDDNINSGVLGEDMQLLSKTVEFYGKSIDLTVSNSGEKNPGKFSQANKFLEESMRYEREFIEKFNLQVNSYNNMITQCQNNILDEGEEAIDCGGVCKWPCSARYNITKVVFLRNDGFKTNIKLNVTSPATNHLPYQRVTNTYIRPQPEYITENIEGGTTVHYKFSLSRYDVFEATISNEVEVFAGLTKKPSLGESRDYFLNEDEYTLFSDRVCQESARIQKEGDVYGSVDGIYNWMSENIKYFPNHEEYSSEVVFEMKMGACDEHANLFNAMSRCVGIPSRKISGFLVNESSVTGHAWNEYYDKGGWNYIDASNKFGKGFITDTKHIASCALTNQGSCGTEYTYTYTENKKPELEFHEELYLS